MDRIGTCFLTNYTSAYQHFEMQVMEPPAGIDPATYGLQNRRSSGLSYGGPASAWWVWS